ncbi:ecotin precursor [Paraburkholderia sp. CNPSo 3272]|uniref:ecotin precursor n=1 Tax=Paraburkholderia sp. CNPSo 3272 TaxID=2940931 RepID=UPI0020B874F1|nr:ecotin precursor [Paraburkholderia sp. CNPSo 3272]MCP3727221.1 ecotin precursor [Paraburkholderia sp. CNPSo 3272]
MRKMAAVLVLAGVAVAAGPASAHDHGGDVVGALVGGALIGAAVGAVLNSGPAVAYPAQPAYVQPAPVYAQPAPVYAAAPAGAACFDQYSGRYVPCAPVQPAPPPPPQYDDGYAQPGYGQQPVYAQPGGGW